MHSTTHSTTHLRHVLPDIRVEFADVAAGQAEYAQPHGGKTECKDGNLCMAHGAIDEEGGKEQKGGGHTVSSMHMKQ